MRSEVGLFRNVMAVEEDDSDSGKKKKPASRRHVEVDSDEEGSQRVRYRRKDPAKDPYFRGYVSWHQGHLLQARHLAMHSRGRPSAAPSAERGPAPRHH